MADNTIYATFDADGFASGFWQSAAYADPSSVVPKDAIEITAEQFADLFAHQGQRKFVDGQVVEYTPPEPIPVVQDYTAAITAMMDAKAQERRYDSALSIATYVGSSNAQWAAEADAFIAWRDKVWAYCYDELDKVQAGARAQPSVADFLIELATNYPLVWPAS